MHGSADTDGSASVWKARHEGAEIEQVPCPLCGADCPAPIAEEWGLTIVRCGGCAAIYVSPRLRAPEKNYWVSEDAKRAKYGAILRGAAPHPRDRNYREHLSVLQRVQPTGRLLDIGTHCGFFLRAARGMGWRLTGIEPSDSSARLAREAFGLDVRCGFLEDLALEAASFEIATMVDVLEHVPSPARLLREAHRVLAPGGLLFVKVPNARYNLLKLRVLRQALRRKEFDIFDSREHVVHYTAASLRRVLLAAGFTRVEYYVPRPIQSGAWWQQAARTSLYWFARAQHAASGRIGAAATDLAAIAWK